jgi:hypothetical protein
MSVLRAPRHHAAPGRWQRASCPDKPECSEYVDKSAVHKKPGCSMLCHAAARPSWRANECFDKCHTHCAHTHRPSQQLHSNLTTSTGPNPRPQHCHTQTTTSFASRSYPSAGVPRQPVVVTVPHTSRCCSCSPVEAVGWCCTRDGACVSRAARLRLRWLCAYGRQQQPACAAQLL